MGKFIQWIKQPSISKPLIAAFLAVLILPVGVLAYFSYQSAWNALDRELISSAKGNVEELNSTLQNKLEDKVKAIDYYSETVDKDILLGKNKTLLKEKFKQYTTLNDDVGAIYAASEDKKLYKYPDSGVPKGFDPTGRDWYKQAVAEKGQAVFSEPYTDEATGDIVVTISKQLKDGSGVIALDLNLDEVLTASKRIKIGKEGFAFITTGNKKYIAHPTIKPGTTGSGDWTNQVYSKKKAHLNIHSKAKKRKWPLRQIN